LTKRYARGVADLTVRQNIQLHWITIEALPEVLEGLMQCGSALPPRAATLRATSPAARLRESMLTKSATLRHWRSSQSTVGRHADFYNLPRKFKISITGCRVWCAYPEINDVGLTAIRRSLHEDSNGNSMASRKSVSRCESGEDCQPIHILGCA